MTSQYILRSGITIYPEQDKAISRLINDLAHKLPAQFILLTDVTGQVISARGEQNDIDLVSLGSLIAGDLAASREIARFTGQYQDYQTVLREGAQTHLFIIEAGHHLAFLVQVSNEVPLGWARMLSQNTARQLAEVMAHPPAEEESHFDLDLGQDDLPDLFSEALNEMWKE